MSQDNAKENESNNDPDKPIWLSTDYDEKHREEAAPLFGTGQLDLHDPDVNDEDEDAPILSKAFRSFRNVFHATTALPQQQSTKNKPKGYGSTTDDDVETNNTTPSSVTKRVGQNLLLRDVLVEGSAEDDDDDGDKKVTNDDDLGFPSEKPKKTTTSKPPKSDGTEIFENKKPPEKNPFGKSQKVENPDLYKPHVPPQNPVLWIFHCIEALSTIAAALIAISQLIPFFLIHPRSAILQKLGFVSATLKCYIILLCITFMLNEIDVPLSFLRNAGLLKSYFSRGVVYSFIGLICVESAYSDRMKTIIVSRKGSTTTITTAAAAATAAAGNLDVQDWIGIFMEVSSWFMVGMGFVYVILGTCCLRRIRDRLKQQEIDAWNDYRLAMKRWKELYV